MSQLPKVDARNVFKSYGSVQILNDVSLTLEPGQIMGLIGPSGAGKSTFLRCVNHLEVIDSGYLAVDGELIGYKIANDALQVLPNRVASRQRSRIGMVFQHFNLFRHLTAIDNVMFAPRLVRKTGKAEAREAALKLLERMGLKDKANSFPSELSGGQQQRVAIARALAMEPTLLLLDEPTSALDPEISAEVVDVIKDLASEGRSMLVASHDLRLVADISDKVVFMVGGRIVEEGPADQVLGSPQHERTRQFLTTLGRGQHA
ncbi:MAG: amino acid ABC transporter ATP-binding protein [Trueperaceae bacterium]|nr:amino acid ABC transporter ATP-binding protein [Trueperaceae bacterium]